MSVTNHERPGVYSVYDVSTVIQGNGGGKIVGLVAQCETGEARRVTRHEEAVTEYGAGARITKMVELLLLNGAAGVEAIPVADTAGYEPAFAVLEMVEDVAIVVCDSVNTLVQQALRGSIQVASQARHERIGVVCGDVTEGVTALVARAATLNDERMVLVAPGLSGDTGAFVAAAVAGAIAGERDPAVPLGGAELKGISNLATAYKDTEMDLLICGGVTPVEQMAGVLSVVRGVTTRTKTGENPDTTWRELSAILIVDEVIPGLRNSLRAKFQRAKNTAQTRGAIRIQVIMELEQRLSREIITAYDKVTVTPMEGNPTVCMVEFAFTVAHGLNQIWLSAHITV